MIGYLSSTYQGGLSPRLASVFRRTCRAPFPRGDGAGDGRVRRVVARRAAPDGAPGRTRLRRALPRGQRRTGESPEQSFKDLRRLSTWLCNFYLRLDVLLPEFLAE